VKKQSGTCAACDLVTLDWTDYVMSSNTASHANGELRYKKITSYESRHIDVVVTWTEGVDNSAACNANANGVNKKLTPCLGPTHGSSASEYFGAINILKGAANAFSGTMTLRYTDTDEPAVVPMFCMTWADIFKYREFIDVAGYGSNFGGYAAGDKILVSDITFGDAYPADKRAGKRFQSTTNNNVKLVMSSKPSELTEKERSTAFEIHFTHTAGFDFRYGSLDGDGDCCKRVYFAGASDMNGQCPKLQPAPPPPPTSPTAAASCEIVGDPHVVSFSGYQCSAQGSGAFLAYKKGSVKIQTFHCPSTGYRGDHGASNVVAAAITDGTDTVEVVGASIYKNGNVINEAVETTTIGDISIHRQLNDVIDVYAGKFAMKTKRIANLQVPTEYQMNLQISSDDTVDYNNDALCSLEHSGSSLTTPCSSSETLFKDTTLSTLKTVCGVSYMEGFMSRFYLDESSSVREDSSKTVALTSNKERVPASRVEAMGIPPC